MSSPYTQASCVACNEEALIPFGARLGYTYYECRACGTIQLYPLPTWEELSQTYDEQYGHAGHIQDGPGDRNDAAVRQYQDLADLLLAYGIQERVLDCGCGWGGLLEVFQKNQIKAEGFDVVTEMVSHCQKQGLNVHFGALETLSAEQPFKATVFSCVFEHLVTHESYLQQCHRLLAPGGLLISLQPTARFPKWVAMAARLGRRSRPLPELHHTFSPPWHTALFSLKGMRTLVERHGFRLKGIRLPEQQRDTGPMRLAQESLALLNQIGWPIFKERWPLSPCHTFIFEKIE